MNKITKESKALAETLSTMRDYLRKKKFTAQQAQEIILVVLAKQ